MGSQPTIRKISVGVGHPKASFHYMVGGKVGGIVISSIIRNGDQYEVYIKNGRREVLWKSFNDRLPICIEYLVKPPG